LAVYCGLAPRKWCPLGVSPYIPLHSTAIHYRLTNTAEYKG
jgi:hypothetical protein